MGQRFIPPPAIPADAAATRHPLLAAFVQAIEAARAFEGATAPNPPVGCVLLDGEGRTLAVAGHAGAGRPHAEAQAIADCRARGETDRIHTAIVTLEPCNHTGRTPPCVDALLSTPAREVWIGTPDPNPVASGGAQRLAMAGLDIGYIADLDDPAARPLADAAARLIAPFAKRVRTGLPWVTVKQALNADGHMRPPAGRTTFTSDAALDYAHRLRRRADAVLTGSGTVLADDPGFDVRRTADIPGKRRHLSILDRRRRVSEGYLAAARDRGFDVARDASPVAALERLGALGAMEVLVEAGPELLASLFEAGLWDEHIVIRCLADGSERVERRYREPLLSATPPSTAPETACSPAS